MTSLTCSVEKYVWAYLVSLWLNDTRNILAHQDLVRVFRGACPNTTNIADDFKCGFCGTSPCGTFPNNDAKFDNGFPSSSSNAADIEDKFDSAPPESSILFQYDIEF